MCKGGIRDDGRTEGQNKEMFRGHVSSKNNFQIQKSIERSFAALIIFKAKLTLFLENLYYKSPFWLEEEDTIEIELKELFIEIQEYLQKFL